MPTYDYECSKCKYKFELFHKMSDEPKAKCPKCGKSAHRLIGGGSGVIFKGSGFYATDYKKKEKPSSGEAKCPAPKGDACKGCPKNKESK
jgi:putative FmdB family regulatory protein